MSTMYTLHPAFELPNPLELSSNMYTLSPVNGDKSLLTTIQDKCNLGKSADLDRRWDVVLEQLQQLKQQLAEIRKFVNASPTTQPCLVTPATYNLEIFKECVINADPTRPPYSLLLLRKLLTNVNLVFSCHAHSSISASDVIELNKVFTTPLQDDAQPTIRIFVVWRKGLIDTELVLSRIKPAVILGEVNILHYLARIGVPLGYIDVDETSLMLDAILDNCHALTHTTSLKDQQVIAKQLDSSLSAAAYIGGTSVNLCDVAAWAAIRGSGPALQRSLPSNLRSWFDRVTLLLQ